MTDANDNGIITQEVVLYDKDGGAIDSSNALPVNVLSMPPIAISGGLTDEELRATAVPVSVATIPSHAVTNAGTFAVQVGALPAGDNNIGNVDIATMPTVTVNSHAVTNAGTFATQVDGAALTALQLIDDCISGSEAQVDIVAALPAGTNTIGAVTQPNISVASAISGQITVTTAGTEVQGGNVALTNGVYIRALSGNTGVVYVGNDGNGAVTSSNGYQLDKGEAVPLQVSNLNQLWFDAATNGDKFCWIKA